MLKINCLNVTGELVTIKVALILKKNKGFKTLLKTRNIINGEYEGELKILVSL